MPFCFEYGSACACTPTTSHREKTVLPHPISTLRFIRLPNWKSSSNSVVPTTSSSLPILIERCLRAKLGGLVLSERIGCWLIIIILGLTKGIHALLLLLVRLLWLHKWIGAHSWTTRLRILKWLAILWRKRGCKSWRLLLLALTWTVLERIVWLLILLTIKRRGLNLELRLLGRLKLNVCRILVTVWIHERRLERRSGLILLHHILARCCWTTSGRFKLERRRIISRGRTNVEWRVKSWRSCRLCWVTKWALRFDLRRVYLCIKRGNLERYLRFLVVGRLLVLIRGRSYKGTLRLLLFNRNSWIWLLCSNSTCHERWRFRGLILVLGRSQKRITCFLLLHLQERVWRGLFLFCLVRTTFSTLIRDWLLILLRRFALFFVLNMSRVRGKSTFALLHSLQLFGGVNFRICLAFPNWSLLNLLVILCFVFASVWRFIKLITQRACIVVLLILLDRLRVFWSLLLRFFLFLWSWFNNKLTHTFF